MTREILFRGKREDNGEWIIGHLLWYEDGKARICATGTDIFCYEKDDSIIQTVAHRVIPKTIGQYTGTTISKVKKVFEGDIVRVYIEVPYSPAKVKIIKDKGRVMWDNAISRFIVKPLSEETFSMIYITEIIGNIHDNPELLEV